MYNNTNIDQLYAQYKQTEQQLMQLQEQMRTQAPPIYLPSQVPVQAPAMGQRGSFMQVHDFKEVENTPVPTNGTPVLFFNFEQGLFWSKKCINGQCCIQDFCFAPLNKEQSSSNLKAEEKETIEHDALSLMLDRLEVLEKKVESLSEPKAKPSGGKAT